MLRLPAALVTVLSISVSAQPASEKPREAAPASDAFTLEQVTSFAFPADLTASATGDWIAWSSVQRGVRNIFVAQGPAFRPRMVTAEREDTGQELTNLAFSADGRFLVWTRGGDHGANWPAEGNLMPNPASGPAQSKLQIWAAPVNGEPKPIAEGDAPAPSPDGTRVAFERAREIWSAPLDGRAPAERLFFARGSSQTPVWSPDGRTLAFVSDRGGHSYIAIYASASEPIRYLAPSTSRDSMPRWSPDGTKIVFVRRPGAGGPAQPPLVPRPQPWSICVVDVATGAATEIWRSPATLRGSYPRTLGGANLQWLADDRIGFLSYHDGWPHLYSVPVRGGDARLLTPGSFMVEYVTVTPDRKWLVYNANTGSDRDDSERRHLFRVAGDGSARPEALTGGPGIEWSQVVTSGGTLAYFGSDARRPPTTYVRSLAGAAGGRALDSQLLADDFPADRLVVPRDVTFKAADGIEVHGQLFAPPEDGTRRPAVIFVHGGPPRQMLLGWHYMFYYANAYGVNQYLASRGFVVLSVNFRLGIGYGYDFHQPADGGPRGASEYQDVVAAAKYLQGRADVDGKRIGIWGGSYGGYLTALALSRNSDLFAAGVDIHGVHNWLSRGRESLESLEAAAEVNDGVTPADLARATKVAWDSSPVASVDAWRSPVLFIHGDDDRNVRVSETIDLVQRLNARGVKYEELIVPDEIHDFLLYRNWVRVNRATVEFLERTLHPKT